MCDDMTHDEADAELARLREQYPVVSFLTREQVEGEDYCLLYGKECPCMRMVAREVIRDGGEQNRQLKMGDYHHDATARYAKVAGEEGVILYARPLSAPGTGEGTQELLYKDVLTGVLNRRYYEDRLRHQYLAAGVALIDLDDFKLVNDTLGHHAGDLALAAVAQAMADDIRESDILVRYGGDEFVLVLPGIASDDFGKKLRHVAKRISQATVPGYPQITLGASIGGVLAAGRTVEDAVVQADKLMYKAKQRTDPVVTEADANEGESDSTKPLILVVDDSEMNREILHEMLKDDYEVMEVCCGEDALKRLEEYGDDISLVLLDIVMPGMNGFEVLSRMEKIGWLEDIPVIMISSEDADEVVLNAYELGASDYIRRPFDARIVRHRVRNTMHLYAKQRRLSTLLAQQFYEREKDSRMLVDIMSGVMELKNGESGKHVLHIRVLTEILLERLVQKTDRYGLTGAQRSTIAMASTLHDIGKMAIDDKILNKPGRLTDEEYEIMKTHAVIGAQMLTSLDQYEDAPLIKTASAICHWHHERWDGRGYPDGLKGDEIPIEAQVVSLADVYDALTAERVYKPAYSHEKSIQMILNGECGQFNPLLLECLTDVSDKILEELGKDDCPPPR